MRRIRPLTDLDRRRCPGHPFAGLKLAAGRPPDLVILDLGLPDLDGLDVLARLRDWSPAPVIVLSARDREGSKIAALDGGADDHLTKPFGVGELLARIRVALRHAQPAATASVLEIGAIRVDLPSRQVTVEGGGGSRSRRSNTSCCSRS